MNIAYFQWGPLDAIQHQFSYKYFRPNDPNFFQHVTLNTHIVLAL